MRSERLSFQAGGVMNLGVLQKEQGRTLGRCWILWEFLRFLICHAFEYGQAAPWPLAHAKFPGKPGLGYGLFRPMQWCN